MIMQPTDLCFEFQADRSLAAQALLEQGEYAQALRVLSVAPRLVTVRYCADDDRLTTNEESED